MRTMAEIDAEIVEQKRQQRECLGQLYPRIIQDRLEALYIERRDAYYAEKAAE
jgi:hypothetical protein